MKVRTNIMQNVIFEMFVPYSGVKKTSSPRLNGRKIVLGLVVSAIIIFFLENNITPSKFMIHH